MGRTLSEKLFRYVKDGRLKRLKSALKKHERLDLDLIVDEKQRTLLHISCLVGEPAIVNVLLNNGASVEVVDCYGNTPLHLAFKYALEVLTLTVYDDLVSPLLLRAVDKQRSLRQANNDGQTPRKLKKKFKRELKERQRDRKMYEEHEESLREDARREREWNEKLFFEMGHDEGEFFSNLNDVEDGRETYNEWAARILRERHEKRFAASTRQKSTKKTREEKEQEHQKQTRLLEEQHEAYIKQIRHKRQERINGVLRTEYESRCSTVFSVSTNGTQLKFMDIPWPCEGEDVIQMVNMIKEWSEDEKTDQKKYLREQQIRWHPDRFLQKCGHRLDESERDNILVLVNQLSQGINALLQTVNKS